MYALMIKWPFMCLQEFTQLVPLRTSYYMIRLVIMMSGSAATLSFRCGKEIYKAIIDETFSGKHHQLFANNIMLPIYLERGLDRSLFLLTYVTFKSEPDFSKRIHRYYKTGNHFNLTAILTFIGKYLHLPLTRTYILIAVLNFGNIKNIDPQPYLLFEQYRLQWSNYDFTSDEFGSFRQKNDWFYQHLKAWIGWKRFNR